MPQFGSCSDRAGILLAFSNRARPNKLDNIRTTRPQDTIRKPYHWGNLVSKLSTNYPFSCEDFLLQGCVKKSGPIAVPLFIRAVQYVQEEKQLSILVVVVILAS